MKWFQFSLALLFLCGELHALPPTGLVRAADYYYSRQDYRQALLLWTEAVKKQPDDTSSVLRLAELKLMIEGKRSGQTLLLSTLQSRGHLMDGFSKGLLSRKLAQILSTFISDEAQSFYLQAKPKLNFHDCEGALTLLRRSLGVEPENLIVLREKSHCEKQLSQKDAYLSTVRSMYLLNPFDPLTLDEYASVLFLFKNYSEIVSALSNDSFDLGAGERRLIYAASLVEIKSDAEALVRLEELSKDKASKPSLLIHFFKGKVFSRYRTMKKDEIQELQTFLDLAADTKSSVVGAEFELEDKVKEAKKRLSELSNT